MQLYAYYYVSILRNTIPMALSMCDNYESKLKYYKQIYILFE